MTEHVSGHLKHTIFQRVYILNSNTGNCDVCVTVSEETRPPRPPTHTHSLSGHSDRQTNFSHLLLIIKSLKIKIFKSISGLPQIDFLLRQFSKVWHSSLVLWHSITTTANSYIFIWLHVHGSRVMGLGLWNQEAVGCIVDQWQLYEIWDPLWPFMREIFKLSLSKSPSESN